MTPEEEWGMQLVRHLASAGIAPAEALEITGDALAEAAAAGADPRVMYGPAVAYAGTVAQAVRSAAATAPLPRMRGPVVLRLRGVSKSYRRRQVLKNVHLSLHAGEVAAIVGANGSGKSTLLNICAGLTRATSGTVERTARIGYAPQQDGVAPLLTPTEHFRLFGAVHRMGHKKAVAIGTGLASRLGWRPREDVVASHLSGGTQQKLNVVLSELNRPELILLDEPYQGFDQGSYVDFWDQVFRWRDGGAGILVVTHMLHDLDRVDHVLELRPAEES
ncbi:ATP-binding cassette domain-containing protein [Actinocorallia populi]|uniref:ATP-binding cassette domain-containing protein n=1 Tax=Actinocorallia populi TaxID=2079200 RepID=UPI000D08B706|nr:ABC transporter ATP-binding protein [Actinocorallia populi]